MLAPLSLSGRRVLAVTDLGQIKLIEVDPANDKTPASAVASLGPLSKEFTFSYPLADEGLLWLADRRISKYEIQLQRSEFVRKSVVVWRTNQIES